MAARGGGGKSTLSAASALYLALNHPDRRFLLVSTDPAHSSNDVLHREALPPNLDVLEINPQHCLDRFKDRYRLTLELILQRGTFLDETDAGQFLDLSMAGIDELMAFYEVAEKVESGHYSCVLLDTAPAGHTLRLLTLAPLMKHWLDLLDTMLAKHRFMVQQFGRGKAAMADPAEIFLIEQRQLLRHMTRLLRSRTRCRFVPVMLADRMSVAVSTRLLDELHKLSIPVADIVVNRVVSPEKDCPICQARMQTQEQAFLDMQTEIGDHILWQLPLLSWEPVGPERLVAIWPQMHPVGPAPEGHASIDKQPDQGPLPATRSFRTWLQSSTKLLMVAGKGGVGKTTLACSMALAASANGRKVLLCSVDPAHTLSDCLQHEIGADITGLGPGLDAVEIDANRAFSTMKGQYSAEIRAALNGTEHDSNLSVRFDREVLEQLFDAAPAGIDELVGVARIVNFLESRRHDLIVIDTAPTGHLLRFLETPELIDGWLKFCFALLLKYRELFSLPKTSAALVDLSKKIRKLRKILATPDQTQIMVVSIPTEIAREETVDLIAGCGKLVESSPRLLLNMTTPQNRCTTCSLLRAHEAAVLARYHSSFPALACQRIDWQPVTTHEHLRRIGETILTLSNS